MAASRPARVPESGDYDRFWGDFLGNPRRDLSPLVRLFRRLPAPPRCKSCGVPFSGPFSPILRVIGFRPWHLNEQLCSPCYRGMGPKKGGAEISVSLLFADVRGSTELAESLPPREFSKVMDRFFAAVYSAVDVEGGVVDHIVGDGVMAMWVPVFGGADHPAHAVAAGRRLAYELTGLEAAFSAGVGVHSGMAWVGVVGETGAHDFTVLGDTPNVAARLGSIVGRGELALSQEIARAAAIDTSNLELRRVSLKGKKAPLDFWVEHYAPALV